MTTSQYLLRPVNPAFIALTFILAFLFNLMPWGTTLWIPDMVALVRSFSDRDPGHFYLFQAKPAGGEKAWMDLGAVREGVKPQDMASVELQRIKARDGLELPVWVTRPAGASGALPAVVLVHGGPWVRGGDWSWEAESQFLASRGYLVLEPEFRGSTGYGSTRSCGARERDR